MNYYWPSPRAVIKLRTEFYPSIYGGILKQKRIITAKRKKERKIALSFRL